MPGVRLHPHSVTDLLARCADRFRLTTDRHRIELNLQTGLPLVWMDEERVTQVVVNLLSNAVKHSPHGGAIVVDATARHDAVRIRVVDHGLGVAGEDRERIRAGSHRAYSPAPGNVSRARAAAQGGEMGVDETPGGGATFWFELRAAR